MYACFGWIHLPLTESTRSQTLHQLSQRRRHQHLRRFIIPRWLSWRGVSLCVDSVDVESHLVLTQLTRNETPLQLSHCRMLKNLNKSANSSTKSKKFRSLIIWPICIWWRQVRFHVNWVNAEWDSTSTESMQSETPRQLSQCRRHQHLRRFYHSVLTQLTWSLTLHWLSWCGISLGVDSVDEERDSASTESPPNVKKFE